MKKILPFLLLLCFLPLTAQGEPFVFSDALGRKVTLPTAPQRAVSFLGSYAECWLLCGGTLAGVTEDALSERGLALPEGTQVIGTTKNPSLELTCALSPDFLLLSADLEAHVALLPVLEALGIPCAYFSVNTWQEYMSMAALCCRINGREDLYDAQKAAVAAPIEQTLARVRQDPRFGTRTALLLRAYSSGVRAKDADHLAGAMLQEMGLRNLADEDGALLETLSMEKILERDPDYIFVVTMGSNPEKALAALDAQWAGSPVWQALSAVRENRVIHLDRTLFHLKPNARWAESYRFLEELLYAP